MLPDESLKLLEDMPHAARGITAMVKGRSVEDYCADLKFQWAVERGFEIIGEALTQLRKFDAATAESIDDWRDIIGFRNLLVHGYAIVNQVKTWDTATVDLPKLLSQLDSMLP